jgi:hypothetical protein
VRSRAKPTVPLPDTGVVAVWILALIQDRVPAMSGEDSMKLVLAIVVGLVLGFAGAAWFYGHGGAIIVAGHAIGPAAAGATYGNAPGAIYGSGSGGGAIYGGGSDFSSNTSRPANSSNSAAPGNQSDSSGSPTGSSGSPAVTGNTPPSGQNSNSGMTVFGGGAPVLGGNSFIIIVWPK